MPGDQPIKEYNPDMEEIFGIGVTMSPKPVIVTEKQKKDPLRKPKVELQCILVAEKLPITAKDIERRMTAEYGQSIDPKKYGFNTMDDLLQACSETVVHLRRRDGVHVYLARVNEATQDIAEMVQRQSSSEARSTYKPFCTSAASWKFGKHGASFRPCKGLPADEEVKLPKGTVSQFRARDKLGPAKTVARLQNMAEVLREYRDQIGIPDPADPNRKIVTLAALAEKFQQLYGLPAWGKNMSENDLYKHVSAPELGGVFNFWRIRDDGDIFVEEVGSETAKPIDNERRSDQNDIAQCLPPEELNGIVAADFTSEGSVASLVQTSVLEETGASLEFSSFEDISRHSSMLIGNEKDDGFFESGPGFGGDRQRREESPSQNSVMSEIAQRFGAATVTQSRQESSLELPRTSVVSQIDSPRCVSRGESSSTDQCSLPVKSMRPVNSAFASRVIHPRAPLKILAEYLQSRGKTSYTYLPQEDKVIVNFGKNIFKVYATQPGEMMVRLVNPSVDLSSLPLVENHLREPIEADLRWMSEASFHVKRERRQLVKPVMFVPPRGFLLVVNNIDGDNVDDKMMFIENVLRRAMTAPTTSLRRGTVVPGMPAVYIYRQGPEIHYYRVLIVGHAHQEGDVMVLLVDHYDQYIADVQFAHLFPLPEKVNFKHFAPNVVFATLYGLIGLTLKEQEVMWKNVDDETRKNFVVGYFHGDNSQILSVDMVWANGNDQLEWLSQIVKKRGAVVSAETDSPHLTRSPVSAIQSFGREFTMKFIDYAVDNHDGFSRDVVMSHAINELNSESVTPSMSASAEPLNDTPVVKPQISPRSLDIYFLFDKFVEEHNLVSIVGIVQFARSIRDSLADNGDWNDLLKYMTDVGRRNNIRF